MVTDPSKAVTTNAVNAGDLNTLNSNLTDKGLVFDANNNSPYTAKLGTTVTIKGDDANTVWNDFDAGKNIMTQIDSSGNIVVALKKELEVDSLTATGDITANQFKAGNVVIDGTTNKISGLTPGDISSTSTDAVNGSQLHATNESIKNLQTDVTNAGFNIQTNGGATEKVGNNDTVNFVNGDNINITNSGKDITVALNKDIALDSVTTGNTVMNNDGITIGSGDNAVSLTDKGLSNGGNQITNVESGLTDADGNKIALKDASGDMLKNVANIGDLQEVNTNVANVSENVDNITNILGDDKYIDADGKLTEAGKQALTTNAPNAQFEVKNTNVIEAINNLNRQGTKFFHVNDGTNTADNGDKFSQDSQANKKGAIGVGMQSIAGGQDSIAIGTGSKAIGNQSIAIGTGNIVSASNSGAIGNDVRISDQASESMALGNKSFVSVAGGVALGANSVADRSVNLAGYIPVGANAQDIEAINNTTKGSLGSVSVGNADETRQITNVAAGTNDSDAVNVAQLKAIKVATAGSQWITANNQTINSDGKVVNATEKDRPTADGANSVAIGAGSKTVSISPSTGKAENRANTVSVGAPGAERTISNVAPGVLNSDAVTVGQLKSGLNNIYKKMEDNHDNAMAGTAAAMAIGNLPQSTIPGKGMFSLGGAYYEGESAMALGLSKMSDDGKWVFKGSASYDSQENAGAALSIGFHF